jgi:hypothetical protein
MTFVSKAIGSHFIMMANQFAKCIMVINKTTLAAVETELNSPCQDVDIHAVDNV